MAEVPTPAAPRGLWARRWFRRTTYALITGGAVTVAGTWVLNRPFMSRWIATRIDRVIQQETGLPLVIERVEVHPVRGQVVLHHLTFGGDLARAERLEVEVSVASLLFGELHVRQLRLQRPRVLLDAQRLSSLRLKPRSTPKEPPTWRVDHLAVHEGWIQVREAAWGVPKAEAWFSVLGQGKGPGHLQVFLDLQRLAAGEGDARVTGRGSFRTEMSEDALELRSGEVILGDTRLEAQGRFQPKGQQVEARAKGRVDLGEAGRLFPAVAGTSGSGILRFDGQAQGPVSALRWKVDVQGRGITHGGAGVRDGHIEARVEGTPGEVTLHHLAWDSPEGELRAQGAWTSRAGGRVRLTGRSVPLRPAATWVRAPFLSGVTADLEGEAQLPGLQHQGFDPLRAQVKARVRLTAGGQPAGALDLELKDGRLALDEVHLNLPELGLDGHAQVRLDHRGLAALDGEGTCRTSAGTVAEVLHAWGIGEAGREKAGSRRPARVPFNMDGEATASATVAWTRKGGFTLTGAAEVLDPRWHGAQADHLRTAVAIREGQLFLERIALEKGTGWAAGELWLSFSKRPGQDEIDMCFRADGLPIEDGLKAADLELPISGVGGGWARIHGPYDRLRIEGTGRGTQASVFGVSIPACSGDLDYDIREGHLHVTDVRIGESPEGLGQGEDGPTGLLGLQGDLAMELERGTWEGRLRGRVDSGTLSLPGPRFQARIEAQVHGPWMRGFGPMHLPMGQLSFRGGRLFLGKQSIEGLEGSLDLEETEARVRMGAAGKADPFLRLDLWPSGERMTGALDLIVSEDTSDSGHLAARLTRDLLRDLRVDFRAGGTLGPEGLAWKGRLDQFQGDFEGVTLAQTQPSQVSGDSRGLALDLNLQAYATTPGVDPATTGGFFKAGGHLPFGAEHPLGIRLEGSANLEVLKRIVDHLLEVDPFSLQGDLEPHGTVAFNVLLGGRYASPMLDGTLGLRGGRLKLRSYPQGIDDLDFTLRFQGRDVILPESEPLRGRVAQGDLTAWGRATWGLGGLQAYDLTARLDHFDLRDLPEGFALQGSLDATLQGTDRGGGLLRGTLIAEQMRYQADINLKEVILLATLGGSNLGSVLDPEDPFSRIGLDLDLVLRQPWEFDTNLLKLRGKPVGAFKVMGNLTSPGLKGRMTFVPGGRITNLIPAGDIVLEYGSVDFQDPRAFNPVLDLQGRVDVPPYLVHLSIRGTLDSLDMQPTSTPSLRRDEITSILIDPSMVNSVGSGSSSASTQSAVSSGLARTSGSLLTNLILADFQERVRKTFNLDRVNVAWRSGSAGSSETTVTLGKTLPIGERRIPLVFTHRTTADLVTVSGQVEWRIGDFVLQLGATQSGSTSLSPSGEIRHTWSPK